MMNFDHRGTPRYPAQKRLFSRKYDVVDIMSDNVMRVLPDRAAAVAYHARMGYPEPR